MRTACYPPSMRVDRLHAAQQAFGSTRWEVSDLVGRLRLHKHPEEIALHREAARIDVTIVRQRPRPRWAESSTASRAVSPTARS